MQKIKKSNTDPNLIGDICSTTFLSKLYGYSSSVQTLVVFFDCF